MERLVFNYCKALGDVNLLEINKVLQNISKLENLKDRDVQINNLLKGRKKLELQLVKMESKLSMVMQKLKEAMQVL